MTNSSQGHFIGIRYISGCKGKFVYFLSKAFSSASICCMSSTGLLCKYCTRAMALCCYLDQGCDFASRDWVVRCDPERARCLQQCRQYRLKSRRCFPWLNTSRGSPFRMALVNLNKAISGRPRAINRKTQTGGRKSYKWL